MKSEIYETIKEQIEDFSPNDDDPDARSWGYEEGLLLSLNEGKAVLGMIDALVDEYKELNRELPFRHKIEQDNVSERMDKIKQALRNAGVTEE